jgi:exopolysaccharide biosynthesis polyprenyl glycosylphosphotransferase
MLLISGFGTDQFIIVGMNSAGIEAKKELDENPELGHRLLGYVSTHHSDEAGSVKEFASVPVLGFVENLKEIAREFKVAGIVITHETEEHEDILSILKHVAELPVTVYIIPDLYDVVTGHFKISFVHGFNLKELLPQNMPAWEAYLKRFMDICVASIGLILASPILLITSIIVKLDSQGPILYTQERVGQYGKKFHVHKFRSMIVDAEVDGPQWAQKKDPRITRIGKFLRKWRIDEIPQMWCVLVGDMSMVGPRPEREHFIEKLKEEIPLYGRRLLMKPGLTGWAQVRHHYDTSIDDVKKKLLYDLYYFENMSILLDVQILVRTIWVVISGSGAQ